MKEMAPIPAELAHSARKTLAKNSLLRRRLPGWGRLHIDRKKPFLCVYRRPAGRDDPGTETLLLSQASYLLASGDPQIRSSLRSLVTGLATELSAAFGRAILLELWSAPPAKAAPEPGDSSGSMAFRIVAPAHAFPQSALETMESALIRAEWPAEPVQVLLHYERNPSPPGQPPLLNADEAEKLDCAVLGLEIPDFYRNPTNGRLYPGILRDVRRELGRVLKQTFFSFSHTEGTFRPVHYHELGRRALTRAVWEVDRQLGEVGDAFDLLLHLTPTNTQSAWRAFRRDKFRQEPEFHYRPRTVDPGSLKHQLFRIPLERIEDPALHTFFSRKQDELDRQITMLGDRGTAKVLYGSQQVYGRPDSTLLDQARAILAAVPPHTSDDRETDSVDAEVFAAHAETELARLRGLKPDLSATVRILDDIPGIMVSRGHLLVGRDTRVAKARIAATIQHEVGTHILTYHNGQSQPFRQLRTGSAGYEELQEGIAVLAEYLVGGLSRPRLRLLAGRVLAADHVAGGATFVDTFRLLHDDQGFSQKSAFTIAMRVHRGGGLTKDLVYLRGINRLLGTLARGIPLADLLIGKIAFDELEVIEELVWRRVLIPAPLRPAYLDDPDAKRRLRRIASQKDTDILKLVTGGIQ